MSEVVVMNSIGVLCVLTFIGACGEIHHHRKFGRCHSPSSDVISEIGSYATFAAFLLMLAVGIGVGAI